MKREDDSEFIEEAREALGDLPPDELQKKIDAAVNEVRARRHRERAERKQNDLAI